jgi:hypothetical protein
MNSHKRRLHSRGFTLFTRSFSLLLLLGIYPWLNSVVVVAEIGSVLKKTVISALLVLMTVALASWLWFRSKPVIATLAGLQVGSGRTHLVPWSRVLDVREVPWIPFSPPWYPKMWQVDLSRGGSFDFCGIRTAREVVIEFVERSEAGRTRRPGALRTGGVGLSDA